MPALNEPYDELPGHKSFGFIIPRSYYYYDTPDGQDLVKKMWFLTTTVGKLGVVHGLVQALGGHPTPKNQIEGALTVLEYTKPYVIVPSIFAIVTHFATNIREKDDEWNYALGGALAGSYMGVWYGNKLGASATHGLFFAFLGTVYKYMQLRDYNFVGGFVPFNLQVNTLRSLKHDFSLTEEHPRQWYAAEEVQEKNLRLPQGRPAFLHE